MRFDLSDLLIVLGVALLGVGLWMTVTWWAFVVMGGIVLGIGLVAAVVGRRDHA